MVEARWLSVSIGVGKVGRMPLLNGARADARRFSGWAGRNGYEPHTFTDETGPVRFDDLQRSIESLLQQCVDRLLIFFSGHGTSLPEGDYWLLSEFEQSGDEAINVALSERMARNHPIKQVAFFGDACRSSIPAVARVNGRSLFRNPRFDAHHGPRVDCFFATKVGAVAQEVRDEDPTKTYGIFADQVLAAIDGQKTDAFEENRSPSVVSSQSLALWLENVIPVESGKIPGASVQRPETRPGWFRPDDWYFERREAKGASLRPQQTGAEDESPKPDTTPEERAAAQRVEAATQARKSRVKEHRALIAAAQGRFRFETRQGVSVIGAPILDVAAEPGRLAEKFLEAGNWHVRMDGKPQSLAVEVEGVGWLAIAGMPGFVATVAIHESRPVSLNYVPSGDSDDYREYVAIRGNEIAFEWLGLGSVGESVSHSQFENFAEVARKLKHSNPTLGILAAYAYDRAGNPDEIDSIAWYFAQRNRFVPFDVALLSRTALARDTAELTFASRGHFARAPVAGSFPLMTQGWALLEAEPNGVNSELLNLRSGLLPTMWTCLDPAHGARLGNLIKSGELSNPLAISEAEDEWEVPA